MSHRRPLPLRANLEWLKKVAKERLLAAHAHDPAAKLSDAQLGVAREFGFASWRKLKDAVEERRQKLDALVPPDVRRRAASRTVAPDDPELVQLLAAVDAGDAPAAAALVRGRPELTTAVGADGATALHLAAERNDPRIAAVLVAHGAALEARYAGSGHTPLSWAVTCNAMDAARALVQLGAEPDLFIAAGLGLPEDVRTFFATDGSLSPDASRTGSSRYRADGTLLPCPPPTAQERISDAMYIACRNGHADVVRFLLARQPDLSFRAYLGGTALHWAYFGGSREVVEMLLAAGADAAARDDAYGCTPRAFGVCVPANWGMGFLVRARLADDPTLANVMDGRTSPLHEAARGGRADVVRVLLEHGADRALRNGDGQTAVQLAAERGHAAVVALLAEPTSLT